MINTIYNLLKEFNENDEPLPLIISTTDNVYAPCYIVSEETNLMSVVVVDSEGHEFAKIFNKDYIIAIEVFYEEMIKIDDDNNEEKMYY